MNRIAILLGAFALLGPAAPAKGPIDLPLTYKPTAREGARSLDITGLSKVSLRIDGVTDERGKGNVVGVNVEDGAHDDVVAKGSIEELVRKVVGQELRALGLTLGDQPGGKTLDVAITDLWVEESNVYKAQAQMRFVIRSAKGEEIWAGLASGSATRWGRSRSRDNYNEVLSDSLFEAVMGLVGNDGARKALGR